MLIKCVEAANREFNASSFITFQLLKDKATWRKALSDADRTQTRWYARLITTVILVLLNGSNQ
jgi:hypothetical protein